MPAPDARSSVRVEVGSSGLPLPPEIDEPSGSNKGRTRTKSVGLVVVLLGILFGIWTAIRTSPDDSANPEIANSDRASNGAIDETLSDREIDEISGDDSTSVAPDVAVDADLDIGPVEIQRANIGGFTSELLQILPVEVGYLGIGTDTSGGPVVWRSLDGVDWDQVETTFELPGDLDARPDDVYQFSGLTATDTGFSVMETWLDFSDEFGQDGPPTTIRRWVSPDAVTWSLDPLFAIREFPTWRSLFHTDARRYGVLGLESTDGPNAWFGELIGSRLIEPSDEPIETVCFWEYRTSPNRLDGFPCFNGPSESTPLVKILDTDLRDPSEAPQLFQCAVAYPYLSGGSGEVVSFDGDSVAFEASFASSATVIDDGTVIVLSPTETAVLDSGCESYLKNSRDELQVIDQNGVSASYELPEEIVLEEMFGFPGGPSLMTQDGTGGVLILSSNGVHRFDLVDHTWDLVPIGTTSQNIRPGDNAHLMAGTPFVVVFDGELLRWGSIYEELRTLPVQPQRQYAVPLYLDEHRLFFQSEGNNLSVIDFNRP